MFFLTVVLPFTVVTVIYFIMFFTHVRINNLSHIKLYLLNGTFYFAVVFAQLSVFFAVQSFTINNVLSGCFFQAFLQLVGSIILSLFYEQNNNDKFKIESEKARLLIRNLSEEKQPDFVAKEKASKVENGTVLQHREVKTLTNGGFNFDGAKELTLGAKRKSSSSLERADAEKAEQILDKAQNGQNVQKREIENAVDSLIKIVSSKR